MLDNADKDLAEMLARITYGIDTDNVISNIDITITILLTTA